MGRYDPPWILNNKFGISKNWRKGLISFLILKIDHIFRLNIFVLNVEHWFDKLIDFISNCYSPMNLKENMLFA